MTAQPAFKDKFIASLLALLTGMFGGHRFYLNGPHDVWGWVHGPLFLLGVLGIWRFVLQGQDDVLTWVLLGVFVAVAVAVLIQTLVIGLTTDARWDARWNPQGARRSANGWGPVLVVIFALFMGVGSLTGGLAYVLQRFFGGLG